MYPSIPICMHQDHGNNESTCFSAIKYGFTSVMMDGSLMSDMKTPSTYQYNVEITSKVTETAHNVGASVEGELGVLGSLETGEAGEEDGSGAEGKLNHDQLLTDPDQAADFVSKTKVDALAIACGTSQFRKIASETPKEFDPRKFLIPAMKEMENLCKDRFERFGTSGNASKITIKSMDEMAKQYNSGELNPKTYN